MGKKVYFREIRPLGKTFPAIVAAVIAAAWAVALYRQLYLDLPVGPYPVTNLGLMLIGFILLSPLMFAMFMKIETQVRSDGVFYRLRPMDFGWHKIPVDELAGFDIVDKDNKDVKMLRLSVRGKGTINLKTAKPKNMTKALNRILTS